MKSEKFYSNGKLLITGEYLVLEGALSFAVPTRFGQDLTIKALVEPRLIWRSFDHKGDIWFEDNFNIDEVLNPVQHTNHISSTLIHILNCANKLNPEFLNTNNGYSVETKLDFPKFWGLGSSSTLINNVAQWAKINAYELLELTFGGSGYDIACAQHNFPLTYQLQKKNRIINQMNFNPKFKDSIFFVHLNKKQNSREEVANFRVNKNYSEGTISEINAITSDIISCKTLQEFELLLTRHEQIVSKSINRTPIKEHLFKDYKGAIKSLGAWGGDFVLVTGTEDMMVYFSQKGFNTIIPYNDMILK